MGPKISEYELCKRSVANCRERLEFFRKSYEEKHGVYSKGELQSILTRLQGVYSRFDESQLKLECLNGEEKVNNGDRNDFETDYGNFEAQLLNSIEKIELNKTGIQIQNKPEVNAAGSIDTKIPVPYPEIKLPEFDGSFVSWTNFRDIYCELVHNKNDISPTLKYYYLQSCLRNGKAFHFIESMPRSAENYEVVWQSLFKHYENETRVKQLHMRELYSLKPVKQENSAQALQYFIDQFWKQYNALKALNIPVEHWDLFLVHHICELVDPSTRKHIELQKPVDKLISISELMEVISKRARVLEAMSSIKSSDPKPKFVSPSKTSYNKPKSVKPSQSFVVTDSVCPYCNAQHSIFRCDTFMKLSWPQRNEWVRKENLCRNCLNKGHNTVECKLFQVCRVCRRKHHTLLHMNAAAYFDFKTIRDQERPSQNNNLCLLPTPSNQINNLENIGGATQIGLVNKEKNVLIKSDKKETASSSSSNGQNSVIPQTYMCSSTNQIMLSTAVIWVESSSGMRLQCRVLIDPGSMSNFVTENLCQRLKTHKTSMFMPVAGMFKNISTIKYRVNLSIESRVSAYKTNLDFLVHSKLAGELPTYPIPFDINKIPDSIKLGDPLFHIPDRIDMLLGAEIYADIVFGDRVRITEDLPAFHNSEFGYLLLGKVNIKVPRANSISLFCCNVDNLSKQVQKFWQIEEVNVKNNFSIEEKHCEENYKQNVTRDLNGRYSVALPTKLNPSMLGESRSIALQQFKSLEKRFANNRILYQEYTEFLEEYERSNHMTLLTSDQCKSEISYFMPHHAVLKENSTTTKLRVVFNASSKTTSDLSLNDILITGPTIQPDLVSLLIRFRKHRIALTADIAKMYRQVMVHEEYRALQQILWRKSAHDPILTYQLNTVTYGTASAPFLAIRTLHQLAADEYKSFPEASKILLKDFYVDDLVTGADDMRQAQQIKDDLTALLAKGCFELRKWCSNIKTIRSEHEDQVDPISILGILWNSSNDTIQISFDNILSVSSFTKRSILSLIAKFFDPLGICAPIIFTAKCFLQKLWSIPKLLWDDELSEPLHSEWLTFINELTSLNNPIKIPRCIMPCKNTKIIELQGFGDASEKGFGCCLYIRTIDENGEINCQFLCSKSKVAPLKRQTIPRLELCAALLLAQLVYKVEQCIEIKFDQIKLWSDSEITLHRIYSPPAKYATFVANRISQIQELTSPNQWTHIPTDLNPADLVSRGIMPSKIESLAMWWKGPPFLSQTEQSWPRSSFDTMDADDPEYSKSQNFLTVNGVSEDNSIFTRFSDYEKLIRVTALMFLFVKNSKTKTKENRSYKITAKNLDDAMLKLIKVIQGQTYQSEIKLLQSKTAISHGSHLKGLNPFLDDNNILRVGGRLANAPLPYDQKFPILIPANHNFSRLLVKKKHIKNLHAGPQALLCCLRQRFWIINGRNLCRKVVREYIRCFRTKPVLVDQIMGPLPINRVQSVRAFETIGIDYCGYFNVSYKIRSKITSKVYIAVYVCFATKATHLELVHDLSTSSFLASFRRFVSRRGKQANVYSDNATNFVGAKSELKNLQGLFNSAAHQDQMLKFCAEEGIQWLTIPARSPHFGGLWEAAVKSAKHHLKRVLGNYACTAEELNTLIIQIEACLNSRPLTSMSSDPSDLSVLTPGHFLIGTSLNSVPEASLFHLDFNRLSRFQRMQYMLQTFWKRWSSEYLSELQQRKKWKQVKYNIPVGTVVLLKEDNVPPLKWVMGRVTHTFPGSDTHTRVVQVKTASGLFRRAVTQLCVLPIETSSEDVKTNSTSEV